MSLLQETKKIKLNKANGVISFIDALGESKHVLYIHKPKCIKKEDFEEIINSLEIKFKISI